MKVISEFDLQSAVELFWRIYKGFHSGFQQLQ